MDLLSLVEARGARREEPFYYLQDGLGSVMQLTDRRGRVKLDYTYDAFGDIRARTTGKGRIPRNVFDFTAQQRDVQSDMLYLRARYYEGTVGRFITRDPYPFQLRYPQTMHRFSYAFNNPVNLADPRGEQAVLILIGVGLIVITGFAIYYYWPGGPRDQLTAALEELTENITFKSPREALREVREPAPVIETWRPTTGQWLPPGFDCRESWKHLVVCILVGTGITSQIIQIIKTAADEVQFYGKLLPKK